MKTTLIFCMGLCAFALAGAEPDFSGYKQLPPSEGGKNMLVNGSFDETDWVRAKQKNPWMLNSRELKINPSFGFSQRGACIERTDAAKYTVNWQTVKNLKPNTRYIYGCKLKVENTNGFTFATVGVEGGITKYQALKGDTNGWIDQKIEFTSSADPASSYNFLFFGARGKTGKACFDEFYVREAAGEYYTGLLNPYNRIDDEYPALDLTFNQIGEVLYSAEKTPELRAFLTVKDVSGKVLETNSVPVKDARAQFTPSVKKPGEYRLDIVFADTANRILLKKTENQVFRIAGAPANLIGAVTFDKYGRMLVDGKPFMPLGMYVPYTGCVHDVKHYFAESPFNCVLAYSGYTNRMNRSKKPLGPESLRESMDFLNKYNIKMILSMKNLFDESPMNTNNLKPWGGEPKKPFTESITNIVNSIKDHPALLAWYITDELPPNRYRELIERRDLINRLDPNHPTTGVYFQIGELAAYSATQDIPSLDFYPVSGQGPQNQKLVRESMELARKNWVAADGSFNFWATPQMFSWTDTIPGQPNYRMPTENEMLAMSLMSAIYGAKGFIYYYYHDIQIACGKNHDERVVNFLKVWKEVCDMARVMKELEPFILSTKTAPKVTVRNIKGETHARAFLAEDRRRRVLISCVGPGEAEAEIIIEGEDGQSRAKSGRKELRSRFGKSVRDAGDTSKFIFKGKDIDCDILQAWPEYENESEITGKDEN